MGSSPTTGIQDREYAFLVLFFCTKKTVGKTMRLKEGEVGHFTVSQIKQKDNYAEKSVQLSLFDDSVMVAVKYFYADVITAYV